MKETIKIAVIAGTAVDTQMGVDYVNKRNAEEGAARFIPVYMPVAEDCDAQIHFQYSDDDGKRAVIDRMFDEAIGEGIHDFFIYCNSLSGAFDFDTYALKKSAETGLDIRVYTPLQAYRRLAASFGRVGVMAANNLSTHAIEETFMAANPDIYVVGTGNMAIVRAIEDGINPGEIVKRFRLAELGRYMMASGAEALVLGCTHFPYFKQELAGEIEIPIIDPADEMYKMMIKGALS